MKILFYGAGVIGSLYAARLQSCGHAVSVLARGKRLESIRTQGIVLQRMGSDRKEVVRVRIVETLKEDDVYDLIVVPVRREQLSSVIPILSANRGTPSVLIMVNNPGGYGELVSALGNRVCVGFPGAGGEIDDGIVRYTLAPGVFQPTTFGEVDGKPSARMKVLKKAFREAGFPTAVSRNIDGWQKTHIAWVVPTAQAVYEAEGDMKRLSRQPELIDAMLKRIRKNFSVLKTLHVPLTPFRQSVWLLPAPVLRPFLRVLFRTRFAENIIGRHSVNAREEIELLAREFAELKHSPDRSVYYD